MVFLCKNKRLKKALAIKEQSKRYEALTKLAGDIGVSILRHKGGARGYAPADEARLVTRIREAIRTDAALRVAWVAVISTIIALLSAIAAWWVAISRS